MPKTLDFIFDFGSPNAYFAYKVLPPILERTGAELNIIPCLLGGIFKATGNQPPLVAMGNAALYRQFRRFVGEILFAVEREHGSVLSRESFCTAAAGRCPIP